MAGITAAAIIGGSTLLAAGVGAAGQAGLFGGGGGGGGGMDKKYMKLAAQTADQAKAGTKKYIKGLEKNLGKANNAYRAAGAQFSNEFMSRINTAIGGAPDYWTTVSDAKQGKDIVRNEFDTKMATVAEDSANQALNWNEANKGRMIAFSQALQKANEQSAWDGVFSANPEMRGIMGQLQRNISNDARGIISAEDAATLARNAAQTSSGAGTGFGSELNRNLSLRDFGLTQFARKDAAAQNTASYFNNIVNPTLEGTKVNAFDTAKWMGLDTAQVLDTNRQAITNSAQMGLDSWDDMLRAGEIVLGTRSDAATTDYKEKMGMEGNIYSGSVNTYNNIANLGADMWKTWGNQRLGVVSQGMANDQARGAQASANSAALTRAGIETAGTVAGAYYQSNKGAGGTKLTNTSYGDRNSYLSGLGANTATDTPATVKPV
jgi:hypothetical protein